MNTKLNNQVFQKLLIFVCTLAIGAGWFYLSSRASEEDLEATQKEVTEIRKEIDRRVGGTEVNVVRICQFLDRKDREDGGPGLACKDPER